MPEAVFAADRVLVRGIGLVKAGTSRCDACMSRFDLQPHTWGPCAGAAQSLIALDGRFFFRRDLAQKSVVDPRCCRLSVVTDACTAG